MSELSDLLGELSEAVKEDKKKQQEQKPVSDLAKEFESLIVEARTDKMMDDKMSSIDTTSDFSSLMQDLASEAQETKKQITDVAEEHQVEIEETIYEPVAVDVPVAVETQEVSDLIQDSVAALSQITEGQPNVPVSEISDLQARVEHLQRQFGELNAIGWGQRGMDYGSGEVRLEHLDDVDRTTAKSDGMYLQYKASTDKWIGTATTTTGFDPAGYEYENDATLYAIENETLNKGLFVEEREWTKITCEGYTTNNLPTGTHQGIAGTEAWPGSGSTTFSRIWDKTVSRFYFDEFSVDTVIMFRVKVDAIPDTNNALLSARINFNSIRDGTDDPVLEDATIVEEYRITLEDGTGDVIDETDSDKFILELGTDMGQGDYPGAYFDTNYKVELETATDGGTGQIKGDFFQAYTFQQTVTAQELGDGAGVEQERTFVFPIYVGDASSQRGYGEFEIFSTSDIVVNDTSILAVLL